MSSTSKTVSSASVLLLVYQHKRVESCCSIVDDVLAQALDVEHDIDVVVVADDSSRANEDETVYEVLDSRLPSQHNVRVAPDCEELRLSEARNYAASIASGDAYIFLDDDVTLSNTWLSSMLDGYAGGEVAVGGPAHPDWETEQPPYLPDEMLWLVGVTHKGFESDDGYVRNVFGCNFSVRADVFDTLGGFPEHLGKNRGKALQGEETALSVKIKKQYGKGMRYIPDAAVYHQVDAGQTSVSYLLDRAYWQGYSKAQFEGGDLGEEGEYLSFVCRRALSHLCRGNAITAVSIGTLTASVGVGFASGTLRSYL